MIWFQTLTVQKALTWITIAVNIMNINFVHAGESTANINESNEYVGSAQCKSCHQTQFKKWQTSDHFMAMAIATEKTVFGNFDNIKFSFNNIESYFHKNMSGYYIDTLNEDGIIETFIISYTIGHWPLQQYLIKTKKGRVQALNIAWDNRTKSEGGQKWYQLRAEEKIDPDSIFFWTKHFQNWNNRCADCHSTNVSKNHNTETNSYQTDWSEINIGCEACHGGGKSHINVVQHTEFKNSNTDLKIKMQKPLQNFLNKDGKLTKKRKKDIAKIQSNMMDTCGGCHSRRTPLGKIQHVKNYHNQYTLQTLDSGFYYANGLMQDEVFEIGSFIQSKMYQSGVTCGNCHDPHSSKLLLEGNNLCLQCHSSESYDVKSHHGHSNQSSGSQCINCHMPSKTFMTVDKRRDHSFSVPSPSHSSLIGAPDVCTDCHQDKSSQWAQEAIPAKTKRNKSSSKLKQYNKTLDQNWSIANQKLRSKDPQAIEHVKPVLSTSGLNPIRHASLLVQLDHISSQESLELSNNGLKNTSPLVRRAAVVSLKNMPISIILKQLLPMLDEPSLTVRHEIAILLSSLLDVIPHKHLKKTNLIIKEYRESLEYGADSPVTLMARANLETNMRNFKLAESYYLKALSIEPNYVPAMVNLADYYRLLKDERKAGQWIERAVSINKNNGLAHHAMGLHYIRRNNITKALVHLKKSTELDSAQPNYFYVYAIALNDKKQAIEVLVKGVELWPNESTLLLTLVKYMDELGQLKNAGLYLSMLDNLAPLNPQVRKLSDKFHQLSN